MVKNWNSLVLVLVQVVDFSSRVLSYFSTLNGLNIRSIGITNIFPLQFPNSGFIFNDVEIFFHMSGSLQDPFAQANRFRFLLVFR